MGSPEKEDKMNRISRHDAVLAHIWSCINRARGLDRDSGLVHCNLSCGLRPIFQLGDAFMGSPIVILNIEMAGSDLSAVSSSGTTNKLRPIAQRIRETINKANDPEPLAAHLHSVAFEKSPQRIWEAFMGSRDLIVTTWARAGLYDADFGIGESPIRYAEGVIPDMDGDVLIKEAPGTSRSGSGSKEWTENGVDICIHIRDEDMDRLTRDPLLLPL